MLARIVEERAIDEAREVAAVERVGERRHAEAERRAEGRVARERPAPAHREDVQAIAGAREDLVLAAPEQFVEHRARGSRNELAAGTRRVALARVALRELVEHVHGIVAAPRGESPRADRGADEVARPRLSRQPLAEDRAFVPGDA